MSGKPKWDPILDSYIAAVQSTIDRETAQKAANDAKIATLVSNDNADVVLIRAHLQRQSNSLASNIARLTAKKRRHEDRKYDALSAAEQTIIDEFCGARSHRCQEMLANSTISITEAKARYEAAKSTMPSPELIPDSVYDDLTITILQLIGNGN